MELFFNTLYQVFSTAPWFVQIILAFSIGLCVLSILAIFICDLLFIPLYGVRVPKLPTLYIWHAGITSLIAVFKAFHIPTSRLERYKEKYEDDIRRLEDINKKILEKNMLKEPIQDKSTIDKHSYNNIEE